MMKKRILYQKSNKNLDEKCKKVLMKNTFRYFFYVDY